MTIRIQRQAADGRLWEDTVCNEWERAFSFIPMWGHVWISATEEVVTITYGQVAR